MHEWALAESIINTAVETADKEKLKKITEINIKLGELQQIEREIFNFALNEIIDSRKELLGNVKINIKTEKTAFRCRRCGHKWDFKVMKNSLDEYESEAIHFLPEVVLAHKRCPNCSSPDVEIVKGRGVYIISIKGEN